MSQPSDDPKDDLHDDQPTSDQASDPPPEAPSKELVEETRIIIRPDGEVVIENLTERIAEVALELDPESELACRIETDDEHD